MQPLRKPERVIWTVGELTEQMKGTLERDFARVCVRGEVSGFRGPHPRGHLYFSLKDAEACIEAKVWSSTAQRLKFALREGLSVVVEGSVDLYAPQGRYSLVVNRMEPVGEGALALAFAQLKERLTAEGLMGEGRKRAPRPLPFLPRRIGVVTSRSGAALQDFLRVLHVRNPRLSVLLCDARVQGEGAAAEVVRALTRLAATDVDVIVVTRGGGSVEDLWAFNEEAVARAIFASPVPVVSAIGHEVDFTIADFVADFRAPTPSAAAERLAPVLDELTLHLQVQRGRLRKAVERGVLEGRQRLSGLRAQLPDPRRKLTQERLHLSAQTDRLARACRTWLRRRREGQAQWLEALKRHHPRTELTRRHQALTRLESRLRAAVQEAVARRKAELAKGRLALERGSPVRRIEEGRRATQALYFRALERTRSALGSERSRLEALGGRLDAMSPLKVLGRGYALVFRQPDGRLLRASAEVAAGDGLLIRLSPEKVGGPFPEVEATVLRTRTA